MFTGIIEAFGEVIQVTPYGSGIKIDLFCSFLHEIKIDQSISHNGVCLTVMDITDTHYSVVAIQETLERSNLSSLQAGDKVNLERCVRVGDRLDGHLVQGHVDTVARCKDIIEKDGSWEFTFEHDEAPSFLTVDKGSISLNGISLTVFNTSSNSFSVAIIPYTYDHTNLKDLKPGGLVNVEFDITGKYIEKILNQRNIS